MDPIYRDIPLIMDCVFELRKGSDRMVGDMGSVGPKRCHSRDLAALYNLLRLYYHFIRIYLIDICRTEKKI